MTAKTTPKTSPTFTPSNASKSAHATGKPPSWQTPRKRTANADARRMRVVGYVRVSTEQQAQEGVSLDAQRTRIKAHCISQGLALVDIVVDDGYSAASLKRPGLQAALRMLDARKADAIVVLKLDRRTRSVKDLGYLCDMYFRKSLLRQIGERLRGERILPPRSDAWHAASVRDLLLDAERQPIAA